MHPGWAPSLDGATHSVHIVLWVKRLCWFERTRLMPQEFETYPDWGAKTLALENTRPPRGETVNPFLFRFESFLGSGRCSGLIAITNLNNVAESSRARGSPGCITVDQD